LYAKTTNVNIALDPNFAKGQALDNMKKIIIKEENYADFLKQQFPNNPENYILFLDKINSQLSYPHLKKILGKGSMGIAYLLADNKTVVKITKDESEAVASLNLINKKNNYIVDIYDVYKVSSPKGSNDVLYVIYQEYIQQAGKLTGLFKVIGYLISYFAHSFYPFRPVISLTPDQEEQIIKSVPFINSSEQEKDVNIMSARKQIGNRKLSALVIRFWKNILDELAQNNIVYRDFWLGNFGKKNNNLCLIDLGFSKSQPQNIKTITLDERRRTL